MKTDLSPKQKRLFQFLHAEIQKNGYTPSLREMAKELGVSHAAVAQGINVLEQKGVIRREGRYSRKIRLLHWPSRLSDSYRWREVPIIGRIRAGLPMYAQQEWDGTVIVDANLYPAQTLFALKVKGNSMIKAGILDGDIAICEPRQYAANGEIVAALIGGEEATIKRFFLFPDYIELRPENPRYQTMRFHFDQVLVQGKLVGIQRGPDGIDGNE